MSGEPDEGPYPTDEGLAGEPAADDGPDRDGPSTDTDVADGMRRGIRSWAASPGRWLLPIGGIALVTSLTAGALAPIAVAALVGSVGGLWGAALNQLGQLGCGYLSDRLTGLVDTWRGREDLSEATIRRLLAAELDQYATGADAAALRADMARLLQSVGAVETAVDAAVRSGEPQAGTRLVDGLGQVADQFAEFRPLLDDTRSALSRVEQSVAEQRQDQQLDLALSEQILMEVGLLRRGLNEARRSPRGGSSGDGTPVQRDLATNPYLGLESFQRHDAARFFGRAALTERLRGRLAQRAQGTGVLLVVGPSGSGKSSLLRAGLVPSMDLGLPGLPESRYWPQLVCAATADPLDTILRWLSSRLGEPDVATRADIDGDPERLATLLRASMPDPAHRVLIVVDQFEQMFAAHQDPAARSTLIRALHAAASPSADATRVPAALVVLVVRADFYAHCASDEILAALLPEAQFTVPPMNEPQLRDVIRRPAQEAGLQVEPALVERIMRDLGLRAVSAGDAPATARLPRGAHQGAVLPLLSHALRETWTAGEGPVLTVRDYERTGGLHGAVAATATDVYERLDQAGRDITHDLLLRLVSVGADTPDTRRGRTLGELLRGREPADQERVRDVVERLTAHRLLTVDTVGLPEERAPARTPDLADDQRIEITHDALLYAWPTLARWLTEDRRDLVIRQQLADAAQLWDRDRTDEGLLLRTTRLADAVSAAGRRPADLSPLEHLYLRASTEAAEAQLAAARSRGRLKRGLTVAWALASVLAVAFGAVTYTASVRSDRQSAQATSQRLAAQSHEVSGPNPRASALLALAAWDTSHTPEARGAVLSLQNHPLTEVAAGTAAMVAASDDGDLLAVVDGSGALTVRGVDGARRLNSTVGEVYQVAFGPGTLLAAAGGGGLEIWTDPAHDPAGTVLSADAATGTSYVTRLAFAGKDGKTLYASNVDGTLRRWHVPGGTAAGPAITVGSSVSALAAQTCEDKAARCLIASADVTGDVRLRDAGTGAVVGGPIEAELNKNGELRVHDLAFSPDGDMLAIASDDQRVYLWSVGERKNVGSIDAHSLPVEHLIFAADRGCAAGGSNSCLLATVGSDGVCLWHVRRDGPGATALLLTRLESQRSAPITAAFVNDGDSLGVSYSDGSLAMWNVDRITVDGAANDLAFDPATAPGAGMAVADGRGKIDLLPVGRGDSISVSVGHRVRNYTSIAYGPQGGRWAAAGDSNRVYVSENSHLRSVLSFGSGSPLFTGSDDADVTRAVFGVDNDTLYTGDQNGAVRKWSVRVDGGSTEASQKGTLATGGARKSVVNMAVSADRTVLAAAFADGTVRLWRTATDQPLGEPVQASTTVLYGIAFSPDHSAFFTGDADGIIRRWDTASGKQIGGDATGHSGPVVDLDVSADGATLASASHDHTVRLWTIGRGQAPMPFARLVGHTDKVNTVAFRPKTGVLYSGSDDRGILRWNLDLAAALAAACRTSIDDIADQEVWQRLVPGLDYERYRHMCS